MNKLQQYFSLNMLSLLGLSLFFYLIFIVLLFSFVNYTQAYNSFDFSYGIISQFYKLWLFIIVSELILFILFIIEFFIKKFIAYPQNKYLQNKIYKFVFKFGILFSLIPVVILILQLLNF